MKRSTMLTVSLLALLAVGLASAWAKSPKDEWSPADKLGEGLTAAAAKDVPLAVLYQFRDTSCPIHNSRVSTYETLQELGGMLKVRTYSETPPADLAKVNPTTYGRILPVVFLADGEGHAIGYIAEETPLMEARETAKQAAAVMTWKRTTRAALAAVEKQIENKQLIPARKQVDLIARQDLAATVAIKASLDKANKLSKDRFEGKKVKPAEAAKPAKTDEPALTEGVFFAPKTAELGAKLDALLTEKLAEIDALLTQGDTQKASRQLAPLLQAKFGDDGDAKVKAMDEKIKTAMKAAAAAAKEAAKPVPAKPAAETKS